MSLERRPLDAKTSRPKGNGSKYSFPIDFPFAGAKDEYLATW